VPGAAGAPPSMVIHAGTDVIPARRLP
jgi:hypothetical protein